MLPEVPHATSCRGDGTAEGVAAATQSDHFVACKILLCCKCVGNEGRMDEIGMGSNTCRDMTDTHVELDVDEMKRSVFPLGAVCSPGRMRKKKAMHATSAMAKESLLPSAAVRVIK